MLTILKNSERGLVTLDEPIEGCWLRVVEPTQGELGQLEEWGFEQDLVRYALDMDETPRMERDEGYTFILLRVPFFQGAAADIPFITVPLGIIVKDTVVATICRYDNDVIRVLSNGKYRGLRTGKRHRFVLYALLETATRYLGHLQEINRAVEALEDQLQKSTRNREVLELLKYQKSLTYFATAVRANQVMMERLQRTQMFNEYDEDADLLEDVLTENQQAIQTVNIAADILSSMMDAFASIISNNLNGVMKLLAAITIILYIPTILTSFYGMNVTLPGAAYPSAFVVIVLISLVLTSGAVYIFAKRDWL
jgi:magnesium transporter